MRNKEKINDRQHNVCQDVCQVRFDSPTVRILAFQASDPGLTPGQRSHHCTRHRVQVHMQIELTWHNACTYKDLRRLVHSCLLSSYPHQSPASMHACTHWPACGQCILCIASCPFVAVLFFSVYIMDMEHAGGSSSAGNTQHFTSRAGFRIHESVFDIL